MPQWLLIAWLILNLALALGCLLASRPVIFKELPTEPSLSPLSPGAPLGISSKIQAQESTGNPETPNFPQKGAQEPRKW